MKWLNNVSVRAKLLMISVPLAIALLFSVIVMAAEINQVKIQVTDIYYDTLYTASSALLNGDRDFYQALVGAFNRVKSGTDEPDDWFKAYWKNYGTLTHRDPGHKFDYPIKPDNWAAAKRRRNRVGQKHENFYDGAVNGPAQNAFLRAFQDYIKQQEDKLKER